MYCDACGHDYLLAFSCKTRYFCPSCHQKRVLPYGEWVEENVLALGAYHAGAGWDLGAEGQCLKRPSSGATSSACRLGT